MWSLTALVELVDQDVEQWIAAEFPIWADLGHQSFEGQFLLFIGVKRRLAHALEHLLETGITR